MDKNKIIEAAAKLVAKGAYDKAIKEYQRILEVDPKDVRVLQKMGELYQKKNDNAQAAVFFTRVAESYSSDGFFLKAVALYKQVLKLNPNLADVNIKLAELHQQLGLMSEAMAYYQLVANHYDKAGDTKSSLGTLKKMVDLDPENVASRIKIAELYAREGMSKEAVSEFRRAAEYLKRNNRSDDYLRVAERLSSLEPENVGLARDLAGSYLSKGDQKRALAKLQVCFKADPRDIETLTLLAQAFQGLGQTSKTLSVYKELAKAYTDKGQTSEASQIWAKIQQLDPNDPDVMARRGGSPAQAPAARAPAPVTRTSAASQAVRNAPQVPAPRTPPGTADQLTKLLTETDVYVKYGLHDKALEHLRKVFSIDPESLDAHEKAYTIYVNAGNQAQAAEQLLNVLRLCTRRREIQRAQPYLATILQQNPRHPEVPAFLAVLRSAATPVPAAAAAPPVEVADDDAILVDSSDEEIIVADAPEDALTRVAAEDLALVSAAPPDADEIVADDDLVMGDPDAHSFEVDEPLMQGGPAEEEEKVIVEEDVALEAEVLPEDEEEEQPTRLMMTLPPELRTAAIGGPPAEQRPSAALNGAVTVPRYKPPPPPARPAPAATKDVTVRAPVPAQPRPAPVAARPAPGRPPPPAPAPPPPRAPVEAPEEAPASEELDEAGFFLDQGQLEAAREVLETVLIAYPDHARAREMMARLEDLEAQASSDEPEAEADEARDAFDLAAELAGDLGDLGATDPAADAVGGDDFQYSVEEVFAEFKKGLQKVVKPEDVDTHYDLGIAYKEMGLIDDAVGEFTVARQGCVGKKKEVDCLTMIGLLQAMKGDHAAAVSSYHEALGSEHATGETAKALEFELGTVLEAMGDAGRALYHFQRVAKADPRYRDVSSIMERLASIAAPVNDPPQRPSGPRGAGSAGVKGRKVGYV